MNRTTKYMKLDKQEDEDDEDTNDDIEENEQQFTTSTSSTSSSSNSSTMGGLIHRHYNHKGLLLKPNNEEEIELTNMYKQHKRQQKRQISDTATTTTSTSMSWYKDDENDNDRILQEQQQEQQQQEDQQQIIIYEEHKHELEIWRLCNLAIPMCYFMVGIVQGLTYPLLNVYPLDLGATEAQQSTIMFLKGLPSCFKIIFGFISDAFPIFGYRRKPYMFIGFILSSFSLLPLLLWTNLTLQQDQLKGYNKTNSTFSSMSSTSTIVSSSSSIIEHEQDDDHRRPTMTMLCSAYFIWATGIWISDVMGDSLVAEKAKYETNESRGNLQAICYLFRFFGITIMSPISIMSYDATIYGPKRIILSTMLVPFVMIPFLYMFHEKKWNPNNTTTTNYNFKQQQQQQQQQPVQALPIQQDTTTATMATNKSLLSTASTDKTETTIINVEEEEESLSSSSSSSSSSSIFITNNDTMTVNNNRISTTTTTTTSSSSPSSSIVYDQCIELWNTACSRAVWQPMGFLYFYILLFVSNSAWKEFLKSVLHFTPDQINILFFISGTLALGGVISYKVCLYKLSWRTIYGLGIIINGIFSLLQICLINNNTFGLSPFLFALGDDSIRDFINGTTLLPACIMMVHLVPTGIEGSSYALFTTSINASMSLSDALSTVLLTIWDVSKETMIGSNTSSSSSSSSSNYDNNSSIASNSTNTDIDNNSHNGGGDDGGDLSGLFNLTLLTTALQLSPLLFICLMPHGIDDLNRLKDIKSSSTTGGFIYIMIVFLSVLGAIFIGIMNVLKPGWMGES